MKRFLIRLILCFIVLVVICMIPCRIYEKKAKECTDMEPYSRINLVDNLKNFNADVVVLGNSRAECGYNVSILDSLTGKKWLNLGISGYPFDMQCNVMYKRYLEQNSKPQFIILETSPITSFRRSQRTYNIEMLPYVGRDGFKAYVDMCPEITVADKWMFVRYFGKLDLVVKELQKLEKPRKQTESIKKDWDGENDTIRGKEIEEFRFNAAIIKSFCGFLDECLEQDVKVILVCSPIYGDRVRGYYDMDDFWRRIKYVVSGKKVPILIYQDIYGYDASYFDDQIHLNEYGGEQFSIQLAHDLDSLGLLR